MKSHFFKLPLIAAALLSASTAFAADWPKGPVRVIVPFGPGSTPDIVARVLSEKLNQRLGQPFVVENKPGAGGMVGTGLVARAQPDGQTIGISIAGPLAVNTLLYKKMAYDPAREIAPVTVTATQASVVVANPQVGASNFAELLDALKKNPTKYNYASMGNGSISHLAMAAIGSRSGSDITHVPYAGSGPAVASVLANETQLAALPAAAVLSHIKAGKLKALAVTTAKRSPLLPDVPTLEESGLKGIQAEAWMGLIAPANTPAPIIEKLHKEVVAVLQQPDVKETLAKQFMEPVGNTPAEMADMMRTDVSRWKPVIQKFNISLD